MPLIDGALNVATQALQKKAPENLEKFKDEQQLKAAAQEFEGIFSELMLKSMRDSVSKSEFIDGGQGEEIFKSMLDSEYARSMSQNGTLGLSRAIEEQLRGFALSQYEKQKL